MVAWTEGAEHLAYEEAQHLSVAAEGELIPVAQVLRQGRSLRGHKLLLVWDQAWTVLDP